MLSQQARHCTLVCAALGAMMLALIASRRERASVSPPRSLAQLTERVSHGWPELQVVPLTDFNPEAGVYLCTSPRSSREVRTLPRSSETAGKWQGVVYCEPVKARCAVPEELLQDWTPYCMQHGSLLFFGDPALLGQLRKVLLAAPR